MFRACSPGDATCRRATPAAPLAAGARLRPDVRIDVDGSVMPVVALSSSREDVLAVEEGTLVAKQPGMAAVLIASADGTIIDFQHLWVARSEEHTSELQSQSNLVCRLLLEKKKKHRDR